MSNPLEFDVKKPLHEYCRNATNRDGDTFVGIKSEIIEGKHQISIHFPLGHRISRDEDKVRNEILQLFTVLQDYNDEQSRFTSEAKEQLLRTVRFPIQAYLTVIFHYINNGYYQITESNYSTGSNGNISISRTLKKEQPIATAKGMVYPKFQVRKHSDTDKDLITEINKYCVYESFLKIGWIYKLPGIPKPNATKGLKVYKDYLQGAWLRENKDKEKNLFKAMLDILEFTSHLDNLEEIYFGTNRFEYIWERLIQETYGNVVKEYYFPKSRWLLNIGKQRENDAIEPDTVMEHKGNIFVLDAKYYKYGWTLLPKDLPSSSSINKQISYGEFIATNEKFEQERKNGMGVFNAFLMPYDCQMYPFNGTDEHYYYIGEAVSDWKDNTKDYERVQGILVDVKFLIENAIRPNNLEIIKISNKIMDSIKGKDKTELSSQE